MVKLNKVNEMFVYSHDYLAPPKIHLEEIFGFRPQTPISSKKNCWSKKCQEKRYNSTETRKLRY